MYNVECRISCLSFCHAVCMAFCVLCIGFSSCTKIDIDEHTVHTCSPMPDGVASAVAFTVDGKAYVFGGRTQDGSLQNTLWAYNPTTDTWTSLGETPLQARVNATACVVHDTVYLGLGFASTKGAYTESLTLRDFWQYIPATNTWKRLADYPIRKTIKCVAFTTDTDLYVGCGFQANAATEMYRYNLLTGTWTTCATDANHTVFPLTGLCGGQAAGRYFLGTGYTTAGYNLWYEYNLTDGAFTKRQPIPTKSRSTAAATSTENYIYVIGGQHFGGTLTSQIIYDDVLRYHPLHDSWTLCGKMPNGGALNMIAFTYQNRVYFGLGEDGEGKIKADLYYIEE